MTPLILPSPPAGGRGLLKEEGPRELPLPAGEGWGEGRPPHFSGPNSLSWSSTIFLSPTTTIVA
jgi:hypothetical protein